MKITKTTLLFIATLFFLALPWMSVGGNAQAAALPYTYDGTGAQHNADGGWTVPANTATCFGNTAADSAGTAPHSIDLATIPQESKCNQLQPAWFATTYPDSTSCTGAGLSWSSSRGCRNAYTDNPDPAYAAARTAHECLYCHSGGHASNRTHYLRSAHANGTRKVDGHAWVTPIEEGSTAYTASSGHAINWSASTIDISGTPTPMYWMFGSWLEGAADSARIIYSGETSGQAWIGCNRCHATGYAAIAAPDSGLEPYKSFPGIETNVGMNDTVAPTTNLGSWQQWGITCSRCHNAVDGGHANSGPSSLDLNVDSSDTNAGFEQATICYACHCQNDGTNLCDPTVTNPGTQLLDGGSAVVKRHANGYLNSPHARFSGTYGQLGDSTMYDTHFKSRGTCAGCHNIHDSVTDTAADGEPWKNECGLDCHGQNPLTDSHAKPLSQIQHPNGPGTPLYGVTVDEPVEACGTCHMPGGLHLFRINPDPAYSTRISGKANCPDGGPANQCLNSIPNAKGFPEVYVDLDLACGQCHGGGDASTEAAAKLVAQEHGAPYYTKAALEYPAEVMHGGSGSSAPTGTLFMWTNDSSTSYAVNFTVGGAACTEGGCTYSWNFGDGSAAGSGPAVSHDYSSTTGGAPVTVTLTVSNGGTNTQIVTPIAAHTAPTCATNAAFSAAVNGGVTGMSVSFADGTTPTTDGTPGVYVNWGDGSPLSVGGTGATFNHTYIWPNSAVGYKVTEIVQDNLGFTCVNNAYVKIGSGGASATTGDVTINVTSGVNTSYYFKQGGLTKVSGSFTGAEVTAGSAVVTVPTGTYDLYLYFATGHTCDYTQGQSATTGDTVNVTCTTP